MKKFRLVFLTILMAATVESCRCSQTDNTSGAATEASPEVKLIARGKAVYMSNCIACHNPNPKLQGSQGPDVYGSSEELLTARIIHAKYPDGYKPKRESAMMPKLPHLSQDIDALHVFLNAP